MKNITTISLSMHTMRPFVRMIVIHTIFSVLIFSSCTNQDRIPTSKAIIANNAFTEERINIQQIEYIFNNAGLFNYVSDFTYDTIALVQQNIVFDDVLFEKNEHISLCKPLDSNVFFTWSYHMYGSEFRKLSALDFEFKPIVSLKLNLKTDRNLASFTYRLKIERKDLNHELRRSNSWIDGKRIDENLNQLKDTTLILPIIQDDEILLELQYHDIEANGGSKDFVIQTDMRTEYQLDFEF